jgi:hypothetical protein
MEKILESFKILGSLGTQILFLIEAHETAMANSGILSDIKFKGHYENHPFPNSIWSMFQNYAFLMCSSFLDEYNEEFTPHKHPEYADRIMRLKRITKPVMRRINKWTDLKDYRNIVLAHNYRIKRTSLFAADNKGRYFNVPHTDDEIVLLSRLIPIITMHIVEEFTEIIPAIDFNENLQSKLRFDYKRIDIEAEMTAVWNEVNSIKQQLNITSK